MTLSQLKPHQKGEIVNVDGDGSLTQRLMALGILPGGDVRVVQIAPFGDPIAVELNEWRLILRVAEAGRVSVTPKA